MARKAKKKSSVDGAGMRPMPGLELKAAWVANILILATVGIAAALDKASSDLYYRFVQEDEILEWASFWAFAIAAVVAALSAVAQKRSTGRIPWFQAGVSLFCFAVAMEEISWGQRILGYRPPSYFLEHNFQQELNVHNVMDTSLRKLAIKVIMFGYGVVLPVLALIPETRRLLWRAAVVAPPWVLAPAFLGTLITYEIYPWRFSGEWVEFMLGLGFLFASIAALIGFRAEGLPRKLPPAWALVVGSYIVVVGLGGANTAMSRSQRGADPAILAAAQTELEALKRDFQKAGFRRCNNHKRLYTFKEKYDLDFLLEGEFAALTQQGLAPERAEFFLDPWNNPYWIRDRCSDRKRRHIIFIYSFGPNRRRDSSRTEIQADDVGTIVYRKGFDE